MCRVAPPGTTWLSVATPPVSGTVPASTPSTRKATLPVGVPAPGVRTVTVARSVVAVTLGMVWVSALTTVIVCWAEPGATSSLPAWSACTTQLPGWSKRTTAPAIEQTPAEPAATLSTTGLPDAPPVAAAV